MEARRVRRAGAERGDRDAAGAEFLGGGAGVMLDDVVAGVLAALTLTPLALIFSASGAHG